MNLVSVEQAAASARWAAEKAREFASLMDEYANALPDIRRRADARTLRRFAANRLAEAQQAAAACDEWVAKETGGGGGAVSTTWTDPEGDGFEMCAWCYGRGREEDGEECRVCRGACRVPVSRPPRKCPACLCTGREEPSAREPCRRCGGGGWVT